MLLLMLVLTLDVNGAIETNIFLLSVNARVNVRVNADAWRKWALRNEILNR